MCSSDLKAAGFAKAALVAIAGFATGGAGLPIIAGLTYALDSAIKGDKLSSVIGKGAGAAALSAAGQAIHGAMSPPTGAEGLDPSQFPPFDDDGNLMPGFHINPENGQPYYNPDIPNEVGGLTTPTDVGTPADTGGLPGQFDGGQYTVQDGDQIGYIAQANGVKTMDIEGLNPQIDFSKPLQKGMVLNLPPQGDGAGSVWDGYTGGNYGDKVAGAVSNTSQGLPAHSSAASDYGMGGSAPIDYSQAGPVSTDSLGQKLEFGIPVNNKGDFIAPNPSLPADELATQQAAYDTWKSDFMRRFPNASQLPDGSMQSIKPGLAPMTPSNYTPGMDTGGLTPKVVGGGGEGALSNVGTDQIMQSPAYKQAFADNMAKFGNGPFAAQNAHKAALAAAKGAMVKESINALNVKVRKLSADKLIDQKSTVLAWALNESIGRRSKSVNLTTVGTYTVFENVERYRQALMELKGVPGSTRPEYYRPDMSGAPAPTKPPKNQSWFGKGLDFIDRGVKKVGGALSNFGHQFTTNVTKEKLKMNWHQAGKPSDSDQLAAWLVKQGVPQEVVTSVYGKMGIPYTAPAAPVAAEPAAKQTAEPTAQKELPWLGPDLKTGKNRTVDQLVGQTAPVAGPDTDTDTDAAAGAGAFDNMVKQLDARPTTSSTGGTTSTNLAKGITTHRASANNPNQPKSAQPTPAPTTQTTAPVGFN